ncbi:glycerophosphodiester phosphodiesterase family protein [Pseudonocardia sulfidoxydans]|uniref:glycerophosphodiester phosphodiesterase family protein n=1 Tax=Pseudonocardia sulfidoxydans TaxID=54011 RepID=UPI0035A23BDD
MIARPGGQPVVDLGSGATTPLVIAHRGASGYRPEHTLAAYELGVRLGADAFEPDLVSTADGVLVARHEPEIGRTTDIGSRPEFADRRTTKTVDGVTHEGWFVDDLTLAELRTLRAVERIPDVRRRNTVHDGRYGIATLDEILELRARLSAELGRPIGLFPEIKHSSWFAARGLPIEPALVDTLDRHGLNRPGSPVWVQSFETTNLVALRGALRTGLVQLLDDHGAPADLAAAGDPRTFADLATPAGFAGIARYADAVGAAKPLVDPLLVAEAHDAGLSVLVFTLRNENRFLPADLRRPGPDGAWHDDDFGDAFAECERYLRLGVEGVFSDHPDTAVAVRDALVAPLIG